MSRRTDKPAFSLTELVLVLAIIGIVSAIALPRFAQSNARYRADAAAQRIITDLAYARTLAMTTSKSQPVVFDLSNDAYSLTSARGLDNASLAYRVDLTRDPYKVDVSSVSFGGGATVTFDIYGTPNSTGKIYLRIGSVQKTVTLDATTGKASAS
jgi:prepilin-type N-terminal cleavage/methylation domain-containing protein